MSKVSLNSNKNGETQKVLLHVLESIIKLLHPFMPNVTEEIYLKLPGAGKSITISDWPKETYTDEKSLKQVNILTELIRSIRNIRNEKNVPLSKPIDIILKVDSEDNISTLEEMKDYIVKFCNPNSMEIVTSYKADGNVISIVLNDVTIYLPLAGLIDLEEEKIRLKLELERLLNEISRGEKMLSNEKFVSRAPKDKIDNEKDKLSNYKKQYQEVKKTLQNM